jgi:exonuclease III
MDSYRKMSKKDYTFNNERSGPGSIVSRIDKLFVSQELDSRGGKIEVAPSIRKMTDHSPWS